MKLLKRLSCFVIATCLAVSCVACSSGDTTWAYEYDDVTIGSGLYIGMSISAYIQASYQVTDYTQSVLSQYIEGVPAKEWILNKTEEITNRYVAIENEFARLGLELTEEENQQIDDELKVLWNSAGDIYEANGVGRNSYRLILANSKKEVALFNGYYGEGGESEVLSSELFDYFKDEYAVINAFLVTKEYSFDDFSSLDEETEDGESSSLFGSVDLSYDKAQAYADRINAGEPFNKIVAEYTAELEAIAAEAEALAEEESGTSFEIEYIDAEDAEEFKANLEAGMNGETQDELDEDELDEDELDEDELDKDELDKDELDEDEVDEDEVEIELEFEDDDETKFPIARSSTNASVEFLNGLFQLSTGKAEIIEDSNAYYVVFRYEIEEDEPSFEEMKETLLIEIKQEEFTAFIEEVVETVSPTTTNQASITRYDPKNINI